MENKQVSTTISEIINSRDEIRDKLQEFGVVESSAKLKECATALSGIENQGAVTHDVKEGETYNIPKGYHNGNGKISGVSGGGSYSLQEKSVTPTESIQQVQADSGYFGLSKVTVNSIPEEYKNTSDATAETDNVLQGKYFYNADGKQTGTMQTYSGKTSIKPTTEEQSFETNGKYVNADLTVDGDINLVGENIKTGVEIFGVAGTYEGSGGVELSPLLSPASAGDILAGKEAYRDDGEKITGEMETYDGATSITPTKSSQNFLTNGKYVESNLTVNAIPAKYRDTSGATATTADVRTGKTFFGANGEATGTLATYSGVTSITPSTNNQLFPTFRQYVENNLIVAAIPSKYKDTSNATVTAADVAMGVTCYGKNGYISGSVLTSESGEYFDGTVGNINVADSTKVISVYIKTNINTLLRAYSGLSGDIKYDDLVSKINLTPDVLKKGVTILGVTGTYEGGE